MRLISAAALLYVLSTSFAISDISIVAKAEPPGVPAKGGDSSAKDGKAIFRFETFGDEQFWTDVLRMHEVIPLVPPITALGVGLKIDVEALPASIIAALQDPDFDLTNPAVTVELVRLNAVLGIKGSFDSTGQLTSIGVTCALCHSTVDDSFAPSIGRRLDGWANTDLDVGKIVALSPAPELDDATKLEFRNWGPGMYDPRHHAYNGIEIRSLFPGQPSLPIVIPPIYGLKGVGFETYTGDGPISYWNTYVGVGQMGGKGNFSDARIDLFITQTEDLVTPRLAALVKYQLGLRTPKAPKGSFDAAAAARGKALFRNEARCATCHQGPTFTDVLSGPDSSVPFLHEPGEVGQDPGYADRTATRKYRTTPLRGLQQHPPYFHDGGAPTLLAVVEHYNTLFGLNLTQAQKDDLVAYLKSL